MAEVIRISFLDGWYWLVSRCLAGSWQKPFLCWAEGQWQIPNWRRAKRLTDSPSWRTCLMNLMGTLWPERRWDGNAISAGKTVQASQSTVTGLYRYCTYIFDFKDVHKNNTLLCLYQRYYVCTIILQYFTYNYIIYISSIKSKDIKYDPPWSTVIHCDPLYSSVGLVDVRSVKFCAPSHDADGRLARCNMANRPHVPSGTCGNGRIAKRLGEVD